MDLWVKFGVKKERITLTDRHGIVRHGRPEGVDPSKENYARPASDTRRTVADALVDADVMIGLASANLVTGDMVKKMASKPIIMALANPDPEIPYEEAVSARPDAVVATGRSDYPNQVNNVLGFPFIFRGALDVRARSVNDEMKLAAAEALAALTRQDVPDKVLEAYGGEPLRFGPLYIIPKPVDPRVLYWVAPAVAKAAIESGSARDKIDIDKYRDDLERKISPTRKVLWGITTIAKRDPKRIVFPEGEEPKILRAAQIVIDEGIAKPILIGNPARIREVAEELAVNLGDRVEIVHPQTDPRLARYADALAERRARRGVTRADALKTLMRARTHFGMVMVYCGDADGCVSGLTTSYPETIRPALQIVGVRKNVKRAAGTYIVITQHDVKFLADTTVNIEPDAETLAETAILTAEFVQELGIDPRVGMLSFSNFGDAPHPSSRRMARATEIVKQRWPDLMIDGEMQADIALDENLRAPFPFSTLKGSANVLIFPNLDAGNIAYKLLGSTAKADVIGPIVLGLRRPVNVLQRGATVDTIVHIAALTVARFIRLERAGLEPLAV